MGRKKEKELVKHVTLEDLNNRIKKGEKSVRVLERLYFVRFIYKGDTIKDACDKVDISEPTGIVGLTLGTNEDMRVLCPIFPVVQSLNWETLSEMI